LYWFSQAANVNGEGFYPNAAGAYIWNYTQAAAAAEGYSVSTVDLQNASDKIALQVFQNIAANSFVVTDDVANPNGFSPQQIIATDAGAGIAYLQSLNINIDYAAWGGTMFAQTALNDPTYFSDHNINLTPGSLDCLAIANGTVSGVEAVAGQLVSDPLGALSYLGVVSSMCMVRGADDGFRKSSTHRGDTKSFPKLMVATGWPQRCGL
jgi:hypothetical protein